MFKHLILAGLLVVSMLTLSVFSVAAQEDSTVHGRIADLITDAPALQIYLNSQDTSTLLLPDDVTDYLALPAASYTIVFASMGEDASVTIYGAFSMDAEAGHDYTIILVGSVMRCDMKAILIDNAATHSQGDANNATLIVLDVNSTSARVCQPFTSVWMGHQWVRRYQPCIENLF